MGIEPTVAGVDPKQTRAIRVIEEPANAPDNRPKCVTGGGVDDSLDDSTDDSPKRRRLPPEALVGVVETALARALMLAAEAGRWEIVAQLAEELAARQRARDGLRDASAGQVREDTRTAIRGDHRKGGSE